MVPVVSEDDPVFGCYGLTGHPIYTNGSGDQRMFDSFCRLPRDSRRTLTDFPIVASPSRVNVMSLLFSGSAAYVTIPNILTSSS
jgi:hypothetical protein